jgi:hypothetical protein
MEKIDARKLSTEAQQQLRNQTLIIVWQLCYVLTGAAFNPPVRHIS